MHWAGVSTVGVQSEQVVIQSLSQVHISNVYPAALGALAYKSDIGTKGHSVNLFRSSPCAILTPCHTFIACLLSSMRLRAGELRVTLSLARY
jgi:hypothetical protein